MIKTLGRIRTGLLALVGAMFIAGCGPNHNPDESLDELQFGTPEERGELMLTANGGATSGSILATGGRGGTLDVTSGGNVFFGVNHPPLPPGSPMAPSTGTSIAGWTDVQTISSGNALIDGDVTAATTGADATLNVLSGDLVINGNLVSGDNGVLETNLVLNVPSGTVWILGSIRTGRIDGTNDGDAGGSLQITALRIIFSGSIDTRGEDLEEPGDNHGGDVLFDTGGPGTGQTGLRLVGGSMSLSGGNATGLDARGGNGGSFRTAISGGAVHLSLTTITCDGGSASGSGSVIGGNGGDLNLQGNAGVFFDAVYSGTGGAASTSSGEAGGGDGGEVIVNTLAINDSGPVAVFGSIDASGGSADGGSSDTLSGGNAGNLAIRSGSDINLGTGMCTLRGADSSGHGGEGGGAFFSSDGDLFFDAILDISDGSGVLSAAAGAAGTIDFDTVQGDIILSGSLIADGGNGSDAGELTGGPSDGGIIGAQSGSGGGSLTIRGLLQANGGSDSDGADDNNGGRGGFIQLLCRHPSGSIYLDPDSSLQADGGQAGGTSAGPSGGDGGSIEILTGGGSLADGIFGGHIFMRGGILARGGMGLDSQGSFGGSGGSVKVDSDSATATFGGADGRGGTIYLESGCTIDASGGSGNSGGNGMSDGLSGVSSPVAVSFDADGNDSNDSMENGVVVNFGTILTCGGGAGALGGDVLFDGLDASYALGPAAGSLDLQGDGITGEFLAQ